MDDRAKLLETRKARNSVFRLLKYRPRSEREIRTKLKQKKISPEVIDDVCEYFKDLDLINDQNFASSWIQYRLLRPFGLGRIRFELKTKGVDEDIINEEFARIQEDYDELKTVNDLAQHRFSKYRNLEREKAKKRVYDYLLRRGFQPRTVIKAIKDL